MTEAQKSFSDISRRGLLQLTAGTAARSVLPPLPVTDLAATTQVVSGTGVAAASILSVESVATITVSFMGACTQIASHEQYKDSINDLPQYHDSWSMQRKAEHNVERLQRLFVFYAMFDDTKLMGAQKMEPWKADNSFTCRPSKIPDSFRAYLCLYVRDESLFSEGLVTQKTILQGIIRVIDEIMTDDEMQAKGLLPVCETKQGPLRMLDALLAHHDVLRSLALMPSTLQGLSARKKIEIMLEYARTQMFLTPYYKVHSERWAWFDVPDITTPPEFSDVQEPIPSRFEELKSIHPEIFCADTYFQRRDEFMKALDSLFVKREVRNRLGMKNFNTRAAAQAVSRSPAALVRSVAAVRGMFSRAGEGVTNIIHGAFKSMSSVDQPPFQALENNPTQNPFDRPLGQEVNTSETTPVLRKPQS